MATQRMSGQFDGACIVEQFSSDLLACGRIIDSAVGSVLLRVHQKPFPNGSLEAGSAPISKLIARSSSREEAVEVVRTPWLTLALSPDAILSCVFEDFLIRRVPKIVSYSTIYWTNQILVGLRPHQPRPTLLLVSLPSGPSSTSSLKKRASSSSATGRAASREIAVNIPIPNPRISAGPTQEHVALWGGSFTADWTPTFVQPRLLLYHVPSGHPPQVIRTSGPIVAAPIWSGSGRQPDGRLLTMATVVELVEGLGSLVLVVTRYALSSSHSPSHASSPPACETLFSRSLGSSVPPALVTLYPSFDTPALAFVTESLSLVTVYPSSSSTVDPWSSSVSASPDHPHGSRRKRERPTWVQEQQLMTGSIQVLNWTPGGLGLLLDQGQDSEGFVRIPALSSQDNTVAGSPRSPMAASKTKNCTWREMGTILRSKVGHLTYIRPAEVDQEFLSEILSFTPHSKQEEGKFLDFIRRLPQPTLEQLGPFKERLLEFLYDLVGNESMSLRFRSEIVLSVWERFRVGQGVEDGIEDEEFEEVLRGIARWLFQLFLQSDDADYIESARRWALRLGDDDLLLDLKHSGITLQASYSATTWESSPSMNSSSSVSSRRAPRSRLSPSSSAGLGTAGNVEIIHLGFV